MSVNRASNGSNNDLSPIRRQAIIKTSAGLSSTGPLGTLFSEILIQVKNVLFPKMHLKISFGKCQPCLQLGGGGGLSLWLFIISPPCTPSMCGAEDYTESLPPPPPPPPPPPSRGLSLIDGILPKGPYLPCVSMAGRALLAGYPRNTSSLEQ